MQVTFVISLVTLNISIKLSITFVSFAVRWLNDSLSSTISRAAVNIEDSDAFTSTAVEDGQVQRNYGLSQLPGVKLTLEWYNVFENRRCGLADKPMISKTS